MKRKIWWRLFVAIAAIGLVIAGYQLLLRPPDRLIDLVHRPDRILIEDDYWSGLGDPEEAHYELQRNGDKFTIKANYVIRKNVGGGEILKQTTEIFEVQADRIDSGLFLMAWAKLSVGIYKPLVEWSDDYPWRKIEVHSGKNVVVFSSASQGNGLPWAVDVNGRSWIAYSHAPAVGFEEIRQVFPKSKLNQLRAELRRDRNQ